MIAPLLLLAATAWGAAAGPAPEGQRLYDAGDYAAASAWYDRAVAADPRDAGLHYDLGNCLFKAGRLGPAIASYQRAFDLLPRDGDIRHNLDFALRRAGETLAPEGVPPLLFAAFHFLSRGELLGLQWLACWLALSLWALYLWRPALRPALLAWALAAAAFWGLAGGWWLARAGPKQRAVIVSSPAEIRSGPAESFAVSFTVPEGRRVQILSQNGDWLEIGVLKEGAKGWIESSAVEPIWPAKD